MACSRSPPSSPRAPKIQQESWDDCGTPPVDLFDPTATRISRHNSHKSRNSKTSSQNDTPKMLR